MKLVSFNVNSVRLRLDHLARLIDTHEPDVIGLQETKVTDEDFPAEAIKALGFHVCYFGQKTHYGVALMTREKPTQVQMGYPGDTNEAQRRFIATDIPLSRGNTLTVINGYFPQGESRDHDTKFPAKEKFYQDLGNYLTTHHDPTDAVAVMGDFNIAPSDNDIGIGEDNRKRWLRTGKASFLPEEREWFDTLTNWGLTDTYRHRFPDDNNLFSWFDYRSRGFEREPKRGLRIDHILVTQPLLGSLTDAGIDYAIRAMPKPSDHCPIWAEFDL